MKITVTESMFRDAFKATRPDQFSRDALNTLFDYYSEMEQDNGEEIELNAIVAICCDWSEYPSLGEAAESYGTTPAEIVEQTTVLETASGVLVLNF